MNKIVGILQPSYLPWLGFFEQLSHSDIFVLYDNVQYDKNGWRNRNRIKGHNRPVWLTVPVSAKHKPLLTDVAISESNWQIKHLKNIQQFYSKAPFFEYYFHDFSNIIQQDWSLLIDLNESLIRWFADKFAIDTEIVRSSTLNISGNRDDCLIKMVKYLGGDRFYEGAAGKNYIDTDFYKLNGVEVIFQNYFHPEYKQLNGDFISHLSALDMLLNCGAKECMEVVNVV